jgi:hypothetical protein
MLRVLLPRHQNAEGNDGLTTKPETTYPPALEFIERGICQLASETQRRNQVC